MPGFLLDTHIWLWLQSGNDHYISPDFVADTDEWLKERKLFISAASVWEISLLIGKKRINLFTSIEHWIDRATEDNGLQLLPLTTEILIESTRLPDLKHKDPADRMLLATARLYDLTLVTRDETMLKWSRKYGHARLRSDETSR
ncbi:type II toxin-antitoxin system VapC family toxin [Terriglobus saanensis]|uniref:PilT protein domain protein n=1 Tax=Terriglobus saanensis (strain ATCC BAA-1853 / DSM 23119 / SP1PR4) TaxID=401053 RepID=E8V654_TERSS|nr:type II toxin-antitoxin system VapC family toxin [Terriglobus saanensis]ADV84945.1 PilT protein domain protein [Terriglobus saanensis SP1PR4]